MPSSITINQLINQWIKYNLYTARYECIYSLVFTLQWRAIHTSTVSYLPETSCRWQLYRLSKSWLRFLFPSTRPSLRRPSSSWTLACSPTETQQAITNQCIDHRREDNGYDSSDESVYPGYHEFSPDPMERLARGLATAATPVIRRILLVVVNPEEPATRA